jgi:predicted DNA-binding transcriptional regulator AlpA
MMLLLPLPAMSRAVLERMAMQTSRNLLKTAEVSVRLKISQSTLAKWRVLGKGPEFVKLGTAVRYDESVIDQLAAQSTRRSTSDQSGKAR